MHLRSEEVIELSKVARYEPRRTGRTYKMIMSLPELDEFEGSLYIVGLNARHAKDLVRQICVLRGGAYAKRLIPLGAAQCITHITHAVDVMNVHFDHTALEYARLKDIKFMYSIIDRQNNLDIFS